MFFSSEIQMKMVESIFPPVFYVFYINYIRIFSNLERSKKNAKNCTQRLHVKTQTKCRKKQRNSWKKLHKFITQNLILLLICEYKESLWNICRWYDLFMIATSIQNIHIRHPKKNKNDFFLTVSCFSGSLFLSIKSTSK